MLPGRLAPNGNLTKSPAPYGVQAATYDEANLPVELVTQAGGAGTEALTARYRYSSAGQRYHTAYTGSDPEHYALDGARAAGVFGESGQLRYWNASGTGRHLPDGSRRYYLTDHLGSVRTVVDGTGALVEARDYYPYGLELPGRTVQASPSTKEGFTGHERDAATGLVYAGARYYMPAVPRWTAVDPLADEFPAFSPYNYTLGNPVSLVDPDGMAPVEGSGQILVILSGNHPRQSSCLPVIAPLYFTMLFLVSRTEQESARSAQCACTNPSLGLAERAQGRLPYNPTQFWMTPLIAACPAEVTDDGVWFDAGSVEVGPTREDQEAAEPVPAAPCAISH